MLLITHTHLPSPKSNRTLPSYSPTIPWQMSVHVAPPTINWGLGHNSWKQLGTKHKSQDAQWWWQQELDSPKNPWKRPRRTFTAHTAFYCWGCWSPEKAGELPTVTQPGVAEQELEPTASSLSRYILCGCVCVKAGMGEGRRKARAEIMTWGAMISPIQTTHLFTGRGWN